LRLTSFSLTDPNCAGRDIRARTVLFVLWALFVLWLISFHVFWRDEARAFSLALSGANIAEMLHNVHGEGHPALWYLILRSAHDLMPVRAVLPIAAAVIGFGMMAIFAFRSPFRLPVIAVVLFSLFGAFEYVVMARNYGISALVMFTLAAAYPRVKNTLWFGLLLAVLCNTNVPACILAAAFLLFRLVEIVGSEDAAAHRTWLTFAGNAMLAGAGALLCFVTVYPTPNSAAVSPNFGTPTPAKMLAALTGSEAGFSSLGLQPLLLAVSCVGLIRKPAALIAAIAGLVGLKLFFYFIYPAAYRHEALYLVFLLSLYWIAAEGAGGTWREVPWMHPLQLAGTAVFVAVLFLQTILLLNPVLPQIRGIPFSRAADAGKLLQRPELAGAIVMVDPDTMGESLAYYSDNPIWFLRQQRFGNVTELNDARRTMTLDDILGDAEQLHQQTGRPIVFLSHAAIRPDPNPPFVMWHDKTIMTAEGVHRFLSSTRLIARLRPAETDESYDVYIYPR
jgi:hypothetical protein